MERAASVFISTCKNLQFLSGFCHRSCHPGGILWYVDVMPLNTVNMLFLIYSMFNEVRSRNIAISKFGLKIFYKFVPGIFLAKKKMKWHKSKEVLKNIIMRPILIYRHWMMTTFSHFYLQAANSKMIWSHLTQNLTFHLRKTLFLYLTGQSPLAPICVVKKRIVWCQEHKRKTFMIGKRMRISVRMPRNWPLRHC